VRDVVVWGATGHAKVLRECLGRAGMRVAALVDRREVAPPFPGPPLLLGEAGLDGWLSARGGAAGLAFAVAVGGDRGADRIELFESLVSRGLEPVTLIHPTAFVADDATLGPGCQVLAQAAVCSAVRMGRAVIVNTAASIDHDCRIGDGVHVAPGAHLAGEIVVGDRAFVGLGAAILPRLRVGEDAVVGAGAVVTRDVPAGTTVVGNPARPKE
jgi:sugar O-acyltransferase (sialic acid O-acetyltransferase NeuD family)